MRKIIHVINQIPPDFEDPGAKEYAPLSDKISRAGQKPKPQRKTSSMRRVMLYLAKITMTGKTNSSEARFNIVLADEPAKR